LPILQNLFTTGPLNAQFAYDQSYQPRDYQVCFMSILSHNLRHFNFFAEELITMWFLWLVRLAGSIIYVILWYFWVKSGIELHFCYWTC